MAKNNVRVKIPRNPEDLLALATDVYSKHISDSSTSALNSLADYNWTDNGAKIAQAQALQDKAKQMERDLEGLYNQRDLLLAPVDLTVKASRDLLLSIYKANYKKLGDWGFEVDDSPKPKKEKATK